MHLELSGNRLCSFTETFDVTSLHKNHPGLLTAMTTAPFVSHRLFALMTFSSADKPMLNYFLSNLWLHALAIKRKSQRLQMPQSKESNRVCKIEKTTKCSRSHGASLSRCSLNTQYRNLTKVYNDLICQKILESGFTLHTTQNLIRCMCNVSKRAWGKETTCGRF